MGNTSQLVWDSVMVLKKRFNYQYRLFIPIVAALWFFAAALAIFHYKRSVRYIRETLTANIDIINKRIVDTYNSNDAATAEKFLYFIDSSYNSTLYDDISVAVYDTESGELLATAGPPMPQPENSKMSGTFHISDINPVFSSGKQLQFSEDKVFYYRTALTDDGRIMVQTVVPTSIFSGDATSYSPGYIIVIFVMTILITIFIYVFTSHLNKNIVTLRDFVDNAVKNKNLEFDENFANDELGEISRKIVELYKERARALESIEREHMIALKATEERNKAKRQLTDNLNHELKTPIGIIKGYIDTMIENPDMDPTTRNHFLNKSASQVNRLTDMLNDVSTITRLEEGAGTIPTERLDFHDVVFSTANDIVEAGINGEMEFVYDIPFDCYIKGNFNLLSNMLSNLAKNAAAYSGGTEMGIKMIAKNKHFYTFSFYDNGKGVDPVHLPHLFDRFYRVDSGRSRKKGGTGLGLPITKNTVLTLGGTIAVKNRKGGGLEFIFTLPVCE